MRFKKNCDIKHKPDYWQTASEGIFGMRQAVPEKLKRRYITLNDNLYKILAFEYLQISTALIEN